MREVRCRLTSTSNGSNETEQNALTVRPEGRLSHHVVTTVTPVAKRANAARKAAAVGTKVGLKKVASLGQRQQIGLHPLGAR